jgi:hypothetical protein
MAGKFIQSYSLYPCVKTGMHIAQLCNGMSALVVVCISLVFAFVTNASVFLSWEFMSHSMWTGTVQVFDNAHAGGKECKMHVIFMEIIERWLSGVAVTCESWLSIVVNTAKCIKWNWSLKSRDIVPLQYSLHIQRPEMLLCKFKPVIIQAQGPQFPGIIAGLGGPIIQPGPGGPYHPSAIADPSYPSNNYTRYMTLQSNGWGDRSSIS